MTDSTKRLAGPDAARRAVVHTGLAAATALVLPACAVSAPPVPSRAVAKGPAAGEADTVSLRAHAARVRLVPDARPETPVWAYEGSVPGPLLRVRQGARLAVALRNDLEQATTVHWHGLRVENAMDGVPFLTQPPVEPGDGFRYELSFPDAGTYWYHPHLGTPEQVGRGLYGALVVDEHEPPDVDRDLVWVIDDWRLDGQARIFEDFYRWSDVAFEGRVGNTVTVNGLEHLVQTVRRGERIRFRLINAANARMVSLAFDPLPAWIVALDGNPLPRLRRMQPAENVFLGPGQRADVIVDIDADPGATLPVLDRLDPARPLRLAGLEVRAGGGAVRATRPEPAPLPPNPLAEPAAVDRQMVRIVMEGGGMMSGPRLSWVERAAHRLRRWTGAARADLAWALNGRAHVSHSADHGFEFVANRGRTVELTYENRSSYWHPMHLHGHMFRELTRNDRPVPMQPWRDTTMVAPRERLTIAFVADNPGDWLIHCHILEHHAGGMGTQFRVV